MKERYALYISLSFIYYFLKKINKIMHIIVKKMLL